MGIDTLNNAFEHVINNIESKEDFIDYLKEISVESEGNKTILYSGYSSSNDVDKTFMNSLRSDSNNRMIDKTDLGKFLGSISANRGDDYYDRGVELKDKLIKLFGDEGKLSNYLFAVPNGAWDYSSKRFAEVVSGEVDVYVNINGNPNRTFFQTEWEAIKNNPNIKTINGLDISSYNKNLTVNESFVQFQALTSQKIRTLEALNNYIEKDKLSINNINATQIESVLRNENGKYSSFINHMAEDYKEIKLNISKYDDSVNFKGIFKELGVLGTAIGFTMVANDVIDAYNSGDSNKAKSIMSEWVVESAGAMVGGYAGAVISGVAIGMLSTAGVFIGAVPATIIIVGASLAGGIFGADLITELYELIVDKDANSLDDELNNKDSSIIDKIKAMMKQASSTASPLVLDVNKDGVINTTDKIVNFDLDNNGYAELTSWVSSEDGILVYDKNNNGVIDNGSELFGNNTTLSTGKLATNGFIALSDYDLNKDGKIDSNDAIYSLLNVWQDLNQNGISEAEEMLTLSELNIDTINTAYTTSSTIDQYGNEHKQIGTFTSNGETYNINDVWFSVDKANTIDLNQVEISEDIAKLPDIQGFGNVSSLHQAIAKDSTGELQRVVEDFLATKDKTLLDEIIFRWTNVFDIDPNSRDYSSSTSYLGDARILEAMENLTGEEFRHNGNKNPGINSSDFVKSAYINFKDFVTRNLLKGHKDQLLSLIEIDKNTEGAIVAADVSKLISFIKVSYLIDTENTLNKISELMLTLKLNKEEFGVVNNAINSYIIDNPSGSYYLDEYLRGFSKDFTDMNLYAKDSFDISTFILGGSSNEDTYGSREDDTFVGSKGDDYFSGNYGKDTYLFKLGDGNDTILENSISSENDKIVFGKGIKKEDINIEINGKNLLLKYSDNDSITIKGWNDISSKRVEYFLFEDGSIESIYDETFFNTVINGSSSRDNIDGLNGDDIIYGNGGGDTIYAKKGDDYIVTKEGKDSIYGEEGNDTIYAGAGDDYIVGGEGNDLIYGEDGDDNIRGSSGDDIIIGGKGDDTLSGGNGSDTYIFSKGDGVDSISDDGTDTTEIDKILFTQEITKSDIVFNYNSSNIKISYSNEDLINITSFKSLSKKRVERMELADGSYLTYNDINNIIQQMNAYATTNDIDITNINNIRQDDGLMNIFENSWRQDQIA